MKAFSVEKQKQLQDKFNSFQHLRFYKRILIELRRATFTSKTKITVASLNYHVDYLSHDNADRIIGKLKNLGYTINVAQAKTENYVIEIFW